MMTALILAAAIVAQPLVDADVLEPSVQNEVDHALFRAPTNEVAPSAQSVAFAALWTTNGASATDRAIALVSSQRNDGRWFHDGKDVTPSAARLLRRAAGYAEPPLRLSIFSDHIEDIERQEKIPFAEAAAKVRALGIDGVALSYGIAPEKLAELRRQGFAVASVIGWPGFDKGYDEALCAGYVEKAISNGCSRILLVPGFYETAKEDAQALSAIAGRTERFAKAAAERGVVTTVEDFDSEKAPTCGLARTRAFLAAAPSVFLTYDTGNFNSPGERPENGLELLPRVRDFHLKDRPASDAHGASPVGAGTVPVAGIIGAALDAGYGGWFTIEHYGATNMLEFATSSARFLRSLHPAR